MQGVCQGQPFPQDGVATPFFSYCEFLPRNEQKRNKISRKNAH